MSKEDFLKLMKDMSSEKADPSNGKKNSLSNRKLSIKNSTYIAKKIKAVRDEEDNEENNDEDEDEQLYNDAFKEVIRGVMFIVNIQQQRAAVAEKLRQEREKELEKKK